MTVQYLHIADVCVQLAIDDAFVHSVCAEGLVEVVGGEISAADAERLRLITVLMREMEVNLAGVEVILHMRDDLCAMQQQFDEILHGLVAELRHRLAR